MESSISSLCLARSSTSFMLVESSLVLSPVRKEELWLAEDDESRSDDPLDEDEDDLALDENAGDDVDFGAEKSLEDDADEALGCE